MTTGTNPATGFRVDSGVAAFLLLVLMLQTAVYLTYPVSTAVAPAGADWIGWWDQGRYHESAWALAAGDLSPERHWYPIGYALLGAPFAGILPRHIFLPANILANLIFAGAFLAYFRPLIGYWPTVLAFLAALLLPPIIWLPFSVVLPFWLQFVIPWNTIPVAAAYMTILLLMRGIGEHPGVGRDVVLGVSAGLIAVTRPVDLLPLAPVVAVYVWQRLVVDRRWRNVAAGLLGTIAIVVPVLLLTFSIHGGLSSPYRSVSTTIGLSPASIPYRALATLLDSATYGTGQSLFDLAPLLFLAVPLALAWAVLDRRNGLLPMAVVLVAVGGTSPTTTFRPPTSFASSWSTTSSGPSRSSSLAAWPVSFSWCGHGAGRRLPPLAVSSRFCWHRSRCTSEAFPACMSPSPTPARSALSIRSPSIRPGESTRSTSRGRIPRMRCGYRFESSTSGLTAFLCPSSGATELSPSTTVCVSCSRGRWRRNPSRSLSAG